MREYRIADEAIVVVKLFAEEDMVTYQRIKQRESVRKDGDEGRNMIMSNNNQKSWMIEFRKEDFIIEN